MIPLQPGSPVYWPFEGFRREIPSPRSQIDGIFKAVLPARPKRIGSKEMNCSGTFVRRAVAVVSILWLSGASFAARDEDGIRVDLTKVVRSNLPNLAACLSSGALTFAHPEACPAGEAYFYVRYDVSTPEAGSYRLSIKGPASGARGYSRYSLAVDQSPPLPIPMRWHVGEEKEGWHDQGLLELSAGSHALELRLYPDQRLRTMNRVTESFVGHKVRIEGIRLDRAAPAPKRAPAREDRGFQLHPGDKVVLFGDSITEEGFYARHLARILESAYPGEKIELFNSGVSLNRVWEGLDRLEADVLALRPDWVLLAFGVNDSVHMAPEEFRKVTMQMVQRLQSEKIKVVLATPSGMLPEADRDNNYFHTPDRARGFDRTMAIEAGIVMDLAEASHAVAADVYGTFTRAGLPRRELMGSQWHPSDEGGRAYALTVLRALGFSKEDALRTGDPRDAATAAAIFAIPRHSYPAAGPRTTTAGDPPSDGLWLAASSFTENSVAAYSRSSGKLIGKVRVGHHPMGIAVSVKRRELYVACEGSGRIDVLRLPEFELAGSIPLGDVYPVSIALSGDDATAWVGTFFGSSVMQVDLERRKPLRTVSIGALVEGVAMSSDGSTVLAAARDKGIVFVDTAAGKIVATVPASKYAASFFPARDGVLGVIDTAAWTLSGVDVPGKKIDPPLPAPVESRAVAWDPQALELWAGDWKNGRIVRVAGSGAPRPLADLEFPFGIAVFTLPGGR
jgi:lysophospholipase L1-like esterase